MAIGQINSTKTSQAEHAYKLAECMKDDDHCRKRDEGGEDFDVADICETGEEEVLQRDYRCQVSCHWEEDEDKPTRPKQREI